MVGYINQAHINLSVLLAFHSIQFFFMIVTKQADTVLHLNMCAKQREFW